MGAGYDGQPVVGVGSADGRRTSVAVAAACQECSKLKWFHYSTTRGGQIIKEYPLPLKKQVVGPRDSLVTLIPRNAIKRGDLLSKPAAAGEITVVAVFVVHVES